MGEQTNERRVQTGGTSTWDIPGGIGETPKKTSKKKKKIRQVGHPRWDRGGIGGHLSPGNEDEDKDIDICTDSGGNCH